MKDNVSINDQVSLQTGGFYSFSGSKFGETLGIRNLVIKKAHFWSRLFPCVSNLPSCASLGRNHNYIVQSSGFPQAASDTKNLHKTKGSYNLNPEDFTLVQGLGGVQESKC